MAGASGPLAIPTTTDISQVTVSQGGRISADGALIGQFRIVDFAGKEDQLETVGFCCFRAPQDVPPRDVEDVVVKQGYQEASNVEIVDELVGMIMVSRMYEANMRLLSIKKDTTNSVISVAMG